MLNKLVKTNLWILILLLLVLSVFASQSYINNDYDYDITGDLAMEVQKLNAYSCPGIWENIATVVNQKGITILAKSELDLVPIWDEAGGYKLQESGRYRIYANFIYHSDIITSAKKEFYSNEFDYTKTEEQIEITPCLNSQKCIDSDSGLNYNIKGGGIGLVNESRCSVIRIDESTEFPSNKPYSIFSDYCIDSKNINEAYCENNFLKYGIYNCPFGCVNGACLTNTKDYSKYSEPDSNHVFLVSNNNPSLIQELQSLVKWIENKADYSYSLLIYDGTNSDKIAGDLAGVDEVTAINDTMIEGLIKKLKSSSLNLVINVINPSDYFSFWETIAGVVYVENNPALFENATDLASSLNTPLIIKGSELDNPNVFDNKYVICIGNLPKDMCDEYYEAKMSCGNKICDEGEIENCQKDCSFLARVYPVGPYEVDDIYPNMKIVQLKNLDGSGRLAGKYVEVLIPCIAAAGTTSCLTPPGPAVYKSDNNFIFEPIKYGEDNYFAPKYEGQHFDEVMHYYMADLAAEWFDTQFGLKTNKRIKVVVFDRTVPELGVQAGGSVDGTPMIQFPLIIRPELIKLNLYRGTAIGSIHEVTHMIFNEVISQDMFNNIISGGSNPSANAMDEGYAVYFPCSYFNKSCYYYTDSTFCFDLEDDYQYTYSTPIYSPASNRDISGHLRSRNSSINNMITQTEFNNIHAVAGSLWDIRKEIGQQLTDKLITESWKIMTVPKDGEFAVNAMIALVQVDNKMYNGTHKQIIINSFKNHNIVCETCRT